jgi:two-component system chemotaxis sensor kinase CheA
MGWKPPDERVAAGKPEQGIIRLNAFHEGGNICITVEDDGRGLNRREDPREGC